MYTSTNIRTRCWKVLKVRKFLQISSLWKEQLLGDICSKYLNRAVQLPGIPDRQTRNHHSTKMLGFFGTSAASDLCHLQLGNGSVHHELNRQNNYRQRSVIRCCSTARGRTKDYYEVLGVTVYSTPQEIKGAYRKLQKQHHPDIAGYKVHQFPFVSIYLLLSFSPRYPTYSFIHN